MSHRNLLHRFLSVLVLVSLLSSTLAPVAHAQDAGPGQVFLPVVAGGQGANPVIDLPTSNALFRTRVAVNQSSRWADLDKLGVVVLQRGDDWALLLVDDEQLAALAQRGFQPRASDEFSSLVAGNAGERAWLAASLQPMLAQMAALQSDLSAADVGQQATARAELRTLAQAMTFEVRAAVADLDGLDADGDGLTNTEEGWWCTDAGNPNSDGDAHGYSDGLEVTALLDFMLPRNVRWNYGPPFGPPAAWPDFNGQDGNPATPACNDGDWDTIPDYAEAYIVGTRVGTQDSENTDGDKFDDGQEFFGTTYCPGAPNSCGWGNYPRTQDYSFITNGMPSWVRPPGDNPFVAAYPVIEFNVDPATIRVVTKEIKTVERTITQGEEISTGYAETKGNSTTVGTVDTNTRSGWQEHSSSEGGIEPASAAGPLVSAGPLAYEILDSRSLAPDTSLLAQSSATIPEYVCLIGSDIKAAGSISPEPPEICESLASIVNAGEARADAASIQQKIELHNQFSMLVTDLEVTPASNGSSQLLVVRWMPVWRQSMQPTGSPAYPILGRFIDNRWEWYLAGSQEYAEAYRELPESSRDSELTAAFEATNERFLQVDATRVGGFYLPYPPTAGSITVTQGENGSVSHTGTYAYDFGLGSTIVAIQGGEVIAVREDSNISCYKKQCVFADNPLMVITPTPQCAEKNCQNEMNYVTIKHDDGTTAHYWHLYPNSATVNKGDKVKRGQALGRAGRTGWSSNLHLHLEVQKNGSTVPIGFVEITENEGKAIEGQSYTSNNTLSDGINACYQEPVCKNSNPGIPWCSAQPTTNQLTQPKKTTGFWESIGRTVNSWWGRLNGGGVMSSSIAANSSQVAGRGSAPIDQSSKVSAGACGSPPQPNGGSLGIGGGGSGLAYNDNGGGDFTALRTWSETTTTGEGWSTSHSDVRMETEYAEITRSTVNTLVSSESWATATTADPTDAARMTFNYTLANTGSDLAVQVTGLRANILIGDLPVITVNLPDRTNIEPSKAKGPFDSGSIALTLDQLAAIDNGAPIRVVLADYGYNDSLYDTNAWGRSVLFHVDDGIEDGDETFDTYLIVTNLAPGETYQATLARFFPVTVFEGGLADPRTGTLTGITTPEYDANGEITSWIARPVNDRAWWELALSTGGETEGVRHFKEMPAKARSYVYLRYMVDTDGDGYTDRTERDAGTDRNDPDSHPRPLLVAAKHTKVTGSTATVQLALQNLGDFDASSVEIWAIAPDDSITIDDNLVGGGGRVRAGRRVVLGARISAPDLTTWRTSSAKPAPGGQFDGAAATTFQFRADTAGTVGSSAGLQVSWSTNGTTWTPLNVGSGYTAWTPLALRDGLTIAFSPGAIAAGETFRFETALPIDTFSYTINRTPHTPPLLVVAYNDAQGNHKFVADVETSQIQEDLTRYYAEMRRGLQLDMRQASPFQAGANRAWITLYNPSDRTISGAKLAVEIVTPDGALAKEYVLPNQTFQPGPNVVTLDWNTADFSPAFDPAKEYHVLAYAADRQDTIIEHTLRSLDTLAQDALPAAVFGDTAWDFGTVTQGEILERTFALANVGFADLQSRALLPAGLTMTSSTSRRSLPGDIADFTLTLDTRTLPTGPYNQTLTVRTSDPAHPTYTIQITGNIQPMTGDAYARKIVDRPLDVEVWVPGNRTQGEWITFEHPLGPQPQSLHPVKVYSQDYATLYGVGKYATDFSAGTASMEMFGDGRDGDLVVNAGQTVTLHTNRANIAASGTAAIPNNNSAGFAEGDLILLHQSQYGANVGRWEFNTIAKINSPASWTLAKPLQYSYGDPGTTAQVLKVPQYRNVTVNSGGTLTAPAWNGGNGGIVAFRANGSVVIQGTVTVQSIGYRGGLGDADSYAWTGEGNLSASIRRGIPDPPGNGGGATHVSCAGGGNGTPGVSGGEGTVGDAAGTPDLSIMVMGGGGGGAGDLVNQGHGGSGGGIIVLVARSLSITGVLASNGNQGQDVQSDHRGGCGGAGGSIFLAVQNLNATNNAISATGGRRGNGAPWRQNGDGGLGRVRIEHCENLSVTTNPPAITQKLNCYIAEQVESALYNTARLNLPKPTAEKRDYRIQYGRKLDFTAAGEMATTLRVPSGLWTAASLDALISGVGSGDVTFKLDVGNDGTWDWETTQNAANAATFSSPDLAAAFAPYVDGAGQVDVPVKVYLSKPGQVLLTNMVVTRNESIDLAPVIALSGLPSEGAVVPIDATIHNAGAADSGPLTISFYGQASGAHTTSYIGSKFVANVPAGATVTTPFAWNTLGFTGVTTVTAAVDPYDRLAESDETNNQAVAAITILTRPELSIPAIALSDDEPQAGETVTVMLPLRNSGQTAAAGQSVALFHGSPESGVVLGSQNGVAVPPHSTQTVSFAWAPPTAGVYRLFGQADRDNTVNESDEANNRAWRDLYVGQPSPVDLDSGAADEQVYSPAAGYGVVDEGKPDVLSTCSNGPPAETTLRRDPDGRVLYRFDHLLPGHFYHLDVVMHECDSAGRQQTVFVDGNALSDLQDLGDGQAHRLSLLLDPALYADRSIAVSIEAQGVDGAVVNQVTLHDVDYRYADAGSASGRDPHYGGGQDFGWLDGAESRVWGSLPYQSVRVEGNDAELRYRFDNLKQGKSYQVHATFWQGSGGARVQKLQVDGSDVGSPLTVEAGVRQDVTIDIPPSAYQSDGSIVVGVVRLNAASGALVSALALEELTQAAPAACHTQETPFFSEAYGDVTVLGAPAPLGAIVQAINPRGETVGCFTVAQAGIYGYMRIYGEDATANPPIAGMRDGEIVTFKVNGAAAVAAPTFYWHDDRDQHPTDLNAGSIIGQLILLKPGWNFFSFYVEPINPQVDPVLRPIAGCYDRVFGDGEYYNPAIPPPFNTLKELHPGRGYYLRFTCPSANLLIEGVRVPVDMPLTLKAGWNMIGYLPGAPLAVATAIQSIAGKYQKVLSLDKTYIPGNPFSTLVNMEPGQGYSIYMNEAATLIYPTATSAAAVEAAPDAQADGCQVAPTPALTLVYGALRVAGAPAPVGTRVEALDGAGRVVGCTVVRSTGNYGFMHVYGAGSTGDVGMQEGQIIRWRIDGQAAQASAELAWQNDRDAHSLDLELTLPTPPLPDAGSTPTYLPLIGR